MQKNKVGIVTWFQSVNYGSQLQAYALTRAINKLGYEAYMISMSHYPIIKTFVYKSIYKSILRRFILSLIKDRNVLFVKKYLREWFMNYHSPSFEHINNMICGSDQIWAPIQYNPYYMLSFVPNNVNKISYAASIGLEEIPDRLVDSYKKYIRRINHVSVRENKGSDLLKDKCGIESTVVLDPTLIVEKKEWDSIKIKSSIDFDYIFCYFLNKNHKYRALVEEYAQNRGFRIVGVSDNVNDSTWMDLLSHEQVGPCEFIGLVEGSMAVVTDSYHGTIFSMLYHKPFILFERFNKEDKICQNSRIEQLKKYFNIDNRIKNPNLISHLEIAKYDYTKFESSLSILREKSLCFLKDALL